MKKTIIHLSAIITLLLFSCGNTKNDEVVFQNGDIVFQTSESKQCEAVRIATNSKFSHCGIIFIDEGKTYVYEAVQPVKITPFEDWISHGKNSNYVAKRLKNAKQQLTKEKLIAMRTYGEKLLNKDYDIYFGWSNSEIYCSELVWKIYKFGADIEICKTKKLKDFNLEHPLVKSIMKERYGNKIPLNEEVVAPSQLHDANGLETIFDNY